MESRTSPSELAWFSRDEWLETMDYLFLDQYLTPSKSEFITEKVLQSRGTTVCFSEIAPIPITK